MIGVVKFVSTNYPSSTRKDRETFLGGRHVKTVNSWRVSGFRALDELDFCETGSSCEC